jgi:hypothetical protein
VSLIGILSKKSRKFNILIEKLCKQVHTKLKSEPEQTNFLQVGAGAGAETNSFSSAALFLSSWIAGS